MVNIIVATANNFVEDKGWPIGKDGQIPWHNSDDLKFFKEKTMGHPVIMGNSTWKSLPKPLERRPNIIVSSKAPYLEPEGDYNDITTPICCVKSVEDAINMAKMYYDDEIFIIGGGQIYRYALEHELVDRIYWTIINTEIQNADVFFPDISKLETSSNWKNIETLKIGEEATVWVYNYIRNKVINNVDSQYLDLVGDIIANGNRKMTRAGMTRSLFGKQLRFNLKEGLPMLTTKKMFSKGVIHELLWFLSGNTNIKYLVDNGVHIWDDDAYRFYLEYVNNIETLKKIGYIPFDKENFIKKVQEGGALWIGNEENYVQFNYIYGDLGPVYGKQWRDWNGHDQIQGVIDKLKNNPDDRRMMVSAWNVDEIEDMALPPCHYGFQFYTRELTYEERVKYFHKKYKVRTFGPMTASMLNARGIPTRALSCMWNQRSVDTGLGLPFNILSYAILTYMIAQCVNMVPDELIFNGGDCHVYENQMEGLAEQMLRDPHKYGLPALELNPEIKNIFDFKYEDIKIEGYESYPTIKLPLSVGL